METWTVLALVEAHFWMPSNYRYLTHKLQLNFDQLLGIQTSSQTDFLWLLRLKPALQMSFLQRNSRGAHGLDPGLYDPPGFNGSPKSWSISHGQK